MVLGRPKAVAVGSFFPKLSSKEFLTNRIRF